MVTSSGEIKYSSEKLWHGTRSGEFRASSERL